MHVTVLQPLLILAAVAIVGAMPLLGVASPVASLSGSLSSARRTDGAACEIRATACATRSAVRNTRRASSDAGGTCPQVEQASMQLHWAVRGGSCVLPPPCA